MITLGIILAADILIGLLIIRFITHVLQQDWSSFKTWWGRCLAVVFALPVTILTVVAILAVWIFYAIALSKYKISCYWKRHRHYPD
jgi:hypothetical protein